MKVMKFGGLNQLTRGCKVAVRRRGRAPWEGQWGNGALLLVAARKRVGSDISSDHAFSVGAFLGGGL